MAESLEWFKYLRQSTTWVPKDRPPLPIAEMDAPWRYNAANWLLRQASALALYYGFGEIQHVFRTASQMSETTQDFLERAMEEDQQKRDADPKEWLKATPLYQALVKDIPERTI